MVRNTIANVYAAKEGSEMHEKDDFYVDVE